MKQRIAALALASLMSLGLVACQSEDAAQQQAATAAVGPAETIERSAAQLQAGNLLALVQSALPPEHYARAKAEWKQNIGKDPASPEDRAKFAETMQKMTAPDAEAQLYAELEPQLAQFEKEMAAQMPLMVGMGRGFALQTLQQSEQLTEEQKAQATQLIDAVGNWLQTVNFFDRELAKQAIAEVVETAREVDVQTIEQIEALEFEEAMTKAGIAMRGLFDVLAVYGLKVDEALASVDAEVLSQQDDSARVKVAYTVFQQPLSFETEMVEIDDRWYGKDAVAELEKAEQEKATGATGPATDAAPADDATAPVDGEPEQDATGDDAADAPAEQAAEPDTADQ